MNDMKKLMVLTAILSVVNFSGCSVAEISRGETKPHISFVQLENGKIIATNNGDSEEEINKVESKPKGNVPNDKHILNKDVIIFSWSPKNNAAIINREGKGCIQGADVFHNQDINMDISNDLLKLVKGIAIDANASTSDKLLAIKTVSQIIQLKTSTERTSYLSIGMFGLCQLYANGKLSEADLKTLVEKLITESVNIVPKVESPAATSTKDTTKAEEPKK